MPNPYAPVSSSGGGNPYSSEPKSKKATEPATPNPTRQLSSELARAQAVLGQFDKKKAAILGDLINRYGNDIPKAEIERSGLLFKQKPQGSLADQAKQKGLTALSFVGGALNRAQQTVFGAVKPVEGKNRLESMWSGLSGHEHRTLAKDILDKEAPTSGGLLGLRRTLFKVASFGGDVATDPVTYVTFGTGGAAKQGIASTAKAVGREGGEAAGRAAAQQVAKQGLSSVDAPTRALIEKELAETLSTKGAARAAKAVESGASRVRFLGQDIAGRGLPLRGKVREELLGQAGVASKAAIASERIAVEQAAKEAVLDARTTLKEARDLVKQSKGIRGASGAAKTARTMANAELKAARSHADDVTTALGFERRLAAKAAEEAAGAGKSAAGIGARRMLRNSAEKRAFTETSANVAGAVTKQVSNLAFKTTEAVKVAGLTKSTEGGLVQAVRDAVSHETATHAAATGAVDLRNVPKKIAQKAYDNVAAAHPEWAGVLGTLAPQKRLNLDRLAEAKSVSDLFEHGVASAVRSQSQGALKQALVVKGLDPIRKDVGGAVDEWVATHIKPLDQSLHPRGLSAAMSLYRRTAIRTPGFFLRNTTTDYLSGLSQALTHKYGATSAAKNVKLGWSAARASLTSSPAQWRSQFGDEVADLLDDATTHNIIGTDVFRTEAKGAISQTRRKFSPLKAMDKIGEWGAQTSEHARITLFATLRDTGMSGAHAADYVRKTLGDYSDYSAFERNFIRQHVAPFYKFHRFNTPFQMAQVVLNPKMAAGEFHAARAFGNEEGAIPNLPNRIPGLSLAVGPRKLLRTNTGLEAALETVQPAVQGVSQAAQIIPGANRLAPLRQLAGGPNATSESAKAALGFVGGPGVGGLAKELAAQFQGKDIFTGASITDRERLIHAVQSVLPEVARAERLSSGSRDAYLKSALSILAGINTIDVTEKSQQSEVYRRLDLVRKLINDAEVDGKSEGWLDDLMSGLGITEGGRDDIPTLTELREEGTLPTPPTTKKASAAKSGNPYAPR